MVGYVIGDVMDNPLSLSCKQTNNKDYWNKLPYRQIVYHRENNISKIILSFPFDHLKLCVRLFFFFLDKSGV